MINSDSIGIGSAPTLGPVRRPASWKALMDARLVGGALLIGTLLALAILAPWIAPYSPTQVNPTEQLLPPSQAHWFGTDSLGFDVFSRVIYAAELDVFIAVAAVFISIAVGLPIGVATGYWEGRGDEAVMRGLDVIQAFPPFILAVGVLATLGQGTQNIVLVVGLVGIPTFVRLARTQVRSLRTQSYVEAARSVGNPDFRLIRRHLVPGTFGTVAVQAAISCGWAIILTASLGFLGLGVPIPQPEWGYMVTTGAEQMVNGRWWMAVFPGIAIAITVLGFNLLGEGIADLVDPRRRRAR
jgi:peptide/nickel transport system permease protein